MDCSTLELVDHEESDDAQKLQHLSSLCAALDTIGTAGNRVSLPELEDDLRHKAGFLNTAVELLNSSGELLVDSSSAEDQLAVALDRMRTLGLLTMPDTTFSALSEDSLLQVGLSINSFLAVLETASRAISETEEFENSHLISPFMPLELALIDTIQTLLQQSNEKLRLELVGPAAGDTLLIQLEEVRYTHDALKASNLQFLDSPSIIENLPVLDIRSNTDELEWQVRQIIGLQQEVFAILKVSLSQLLQNGDSSELSAKLVSLGVDRLDEILERVSSHNFDSAADSLRPSATLIQPYIERQHKVLTALEQHIPILLEAELRNWDRSASSIRESIVLLVEMQTTLEEAHLALLRSTVGEVEKYGARLVTAIIVLLIAFFLVRGVVWLLETLAARSALRRLFFKKLVPVGRLVIWGLTVYFILAIVLRLDRSGLIAAATALGVAIGFAAQDILKNIIGGILIVFDQPFQVGDKINIGGTYGEVSSIGLRSTRIVTPDDNLVTVPNAQVVDSQVFNSNAGELFCQVVVDLFLPGWIDVSEAKSIAYSAAANSKYVYLEKPIVVIIKDVFKETFLTRIRVKAYVLDTRYESAFASAVTETAKAEFLRKGFYDNISEDSYMLSKRNDNRNEFGQRGKRN